MQIHGIIIMNKCERRAFFMKINKLFLKFKIKMLMESILRAFIIALMLSGLTAFVTSLVYHIQIKESNYAFMTMVCSGVFALAFIAVLLIAFPTSKRVARRMDETGLKERVSTMLENRDNNDNVAKFQRHDAVDHINNLSVKKLPFRIFKREVLSCIICICLSVVMICLPSDIFAFAEDEIDVSKEQ